MKTIICNFGLIVLLGQTACDPGQSGTASIDNQSSEIMTLYNQTRYLDTTIVIRSKAKKVVQSIGGEG